MKALIQRVSEAHVSVEGEIVSQIQAGYLIYLGITHNDTEETAKRLVKKILALRIFSDNNDKINLSLLDVNGQLLIVSQFTLYADTSRGNRPSFTQSAPPARAEALYEYFAHLCRQKIHPVGQGVFGAHMDVFSVNDGPFSIMLEDSNP